MMLRAYSCSGAAHRVPIDLNLKGLVFDQRFRQLRWLSLVGTPTVPTLSQRFFVEHLGRRRTVGPLPSRPAATRCDSGYFTVVARIGKARTHWH